MSRPKKGEERPRIGLRDIKIRFRLLATPPVPKENMVEALELLLAFQDDDEVVELFLDIADAAQR